MTSMTITGIDAFDVFFSLAVYIGIPILLLLGAMLFLRD